MALFRFRNIADDVDMMKLSRFAAQKRDAKRNKLGDVLQVLDRHVDFVALAPDLLEKIKSIRT